MGNPEDTLNCWGEEADMIDSSLWKGCLKVAEEAMSTREGQCHGLELSKDLMPFGDGGVAWGGHN